METLFVVIPAYNESANINKCVDDWYHIVESHNSSGRSRLVIIDDGSKDNTYQLLTDLAKTRPLLLPLTKPNGGHGSAVLWGYRYAIKEGADFIFQTDSDGQTDPAEFDSFWEKKDEFDAILGNRTNRGDGKGRKIVEKTVCLLLRLIFGIRIEDANAPFRLMKTNLVAKYIDRLPQNYNLPNIMFSTFFVFYNENIIFCPVSFKPRQGGTNSINLKKIIKIGFKAIGDFFKFKKEMDNC